ncbi:PREDICTED: uncharacterized protein LOC105125516 [Populus euphratica]|uniref:Uncharacterized protein LOC105125516 n=1 Tax=Populus euphratica TaxID=75702 RepID=A0AAJ6U6Z9_POPEU|nr:PREDICTED: uncharacterized protein LOC105125516 [Populus euphratica]
MKMVFREFHFIRLIIMNMFKWNCRGAGSNRFCSIVYDFRKAYGIEIMTFIEPRISGRAAGKVIDKLNFDSNFKVEAEGKFGGIWLLWNKGGVDLRVSNSSKHLVHVLVDKGGGSPWLCTILTAAEKMEGTRVDMRKCLRFNRWIQDCGLLDLRSVGSKFTWREHESRGYGRVHGRLDRGPGNQLCRLQFPAMYVRVLPRVKSDHHPTFVELNSRDMHTLKHCRPFKFEAAWTSHDSFTKVIKKLLAGE